MVFVAAKENVVLLGPPGAGKTHLATGLAIRACQAGHRIQFATASQWVNRLAEAHHVGQLQDELRRLVRYPVLVIDEVGYIPFDTQGRPGDPDPARIISAGAAETVQAVPGLCKPLPKPDWVRAQAADAKPLEPVTELVDIAVLDPTASGSQSEVIHPFLPAVETWRKNELARVHSRAAAPVSLARGSAEALAVEARKVGALAPAAETAR